MPVCSYLVIPERGAAKTLARRLEVLPGCDVARAENQEVLLLVTDTPNAKEDRELRASLEGMKGIHALVLAFGEIDPDTEEADPLGAGRKHRTERRLPVLDPGGLRADLPTPDPTPEPENP